MNNLYADGQLIATGQGGALVSATLTHTSLGAEDVETDTSSLDAQPWKYLPGTNRRDQCVEHYAL